MTRKILLILTLFIAAQLSIHAAPGFLFRKYATENGLPSITARAIVQDHKGLIWVGTADGLASFDGREFIRHNMSQWEEDVYINCLWVDSEGLLWIGSSQAISCLESGLFIGLGTDVTALAEDSNGNIWCSTRGKGIIRYSKPEGKTYSYMEGGDYENIFVDSHDMVLASCTKGYEIHSYNNVTDDFINLDVRFEDCQPSRISDFHEDGSGNLLAGSWNYGLYRFNRNTGTFSPAPGNTSGIMHIHSLSGFSTNSMLIGADGGLFFYDVTTGEVSDTGCNGFVYDSLHDREGGTWAVSYYGGISYSAPHADQFQHFKPGGDDYVISRIAETEDGSIWVGSDNGGLLRFNSSTLSYSGQFLKNKNVHALLPDGNTLWVGSYSGGIDQIDIRSGAVRHIASPANSYYTIVKDSKGRIWASSMEDVQIYDSTTGRFETIYASGMEFYDIEEDKDGSMWFASESDGLFRYDPSSRSWSNIRKGDNGLGGNDIHSIYSSPDGSLWVGCDEGLYHKSPSATDFEKIDAGNAREVFYVTSEGQYLWLATENGVVKFNPSNGRAERYGKDNGLLAMHFMSGAGLKSSDGRIYLGTTDGMSSFMPADVRYNDYAPPVLITRVNVYDRSRRNPKEPKTYETLAPQSAIILSHDRNHLVFTFAALSYCAPEINSYQYLLEGFDQQWTDAEHIGRAEYTNLPAGHYILRVRAMNNDGIWSTEDETVEFTIRPHPLMSGTAMGIYIILFLLAMVGIGTYMNKKIEALSQEKFDIKIKEFEEVKRQQQETEFEDKLNQIIKDNISNTDLSAEDIARELCVSRSGLFAKVKEATGKTPHQLILEARLEEACRLLKENKKSIADISVLVGFNSTAYFSKCFSKEMGLSPAEWQKNNI